MFTMFKNISPAHPTHVGQEFKFKAILHPYKGDWNDLRHFPVYEQSGVRKIKYDTFMLGKIDHTEKIADKVVEISYTIGDYEMLDNIVQQYGVYCGYFALVQAVNKMAAIAYSIADTAEMREFKKLASIGFKKSIDLIQSLDKINESIDKFNYHLTGFYASYGISESDKDLVRIKNLNINSPIYTRQNDEDLDGTITRAWCLISIKHRIISSETNCLFFLPYLDIDNFELNIQQFVTQMDNTYSICLEIDNPIDFGFEFQFKTLFCNPHYFGYITNETKTMWQLFNDILNWTNHAQN